MLTWILSFQALVSYDKLAILMHELLVIEVGLPLPPLSLMLYLFSIYVLSIIYHVIKRWQDWAPKASSLWNVWNRGLSCVGPPCSGGFTGRSLC